MKINIYNSLVGILPLSMSIIAMGIHLEHGGEFLSLHMLAILVCMGIGVLGCTGYLDRYDHRGGK